MSSEKGRNDIRPGQHPFSSTGRVEGGSESYEVYGTKGYYKTFQPQYKGRPLKHTEMDFNIDLIGQVIRGYRVVGNDILVPDELDLVNDLDKLLTFTSRDMIDAEGNTVYEDDGVTPKLEYIWQLISAGSLSGSKGDKGDSGTNGVQGAQGAQGAQGITGQTGLTGAKGSTGAQGSQGIAGSPLQASIAYMYTYDTSSPSGFPMNTAKAQWFEMEGCLVLNVDDANGADQTNRIKSLVESGSFDITFVNQNGQNNYHHLNIKNAFIDDTSFLNCIAFYVSKINGSNVVNPNPNATGEAKSYNNLGLSTTIAANAFIDKCVQETAYLTINVVPFSQNVANFSEYKDAYATIHEDLIGWTIDSITASWGKTTPNSGNEWQIQHLDDSGSSSQLATFVHPDFTRIHKEFFTNMQALNAGTLHVTPTITPDLSAEGYSATIKLVRY